LDLHLMNLKEIKELVDLITEKGISEFELERAGVRLKISRPTGAAAVQVVSQAASQPAEMRTALSQEVPSAPPRVMLAPAPVSAAAAEPISSPDGLHVVRSPMVGTFYSAPSQDSPVFVQIGDRVQPGQVLCIIEAMKLMNEIEAEISGEIVACHVENGQPVEYGEPLFDVRPAGAAAKRG
jgi:acetyl-CoA carboxylase biotin carboxyl carrier protein